MAKTSGGVKVDSKMKGFILSLAFTLGINLMLSLLDLFAGLMGNILVKIKVLNYIIAGILFSMGLWLLKSFKININYNFTKFKLKKGSGILGAFLCGIPFGFVASPCTVPVTISVLAYSALKGSIFYGMLLMFIFGIGRSIPLLIVGTFTGFLRNIKFLFKYQRVIEKVAGAILIILAIFFIWQSITN